MAKDAKRYNVQNENDPTIGHITEEKESELEEFIDNSKIVMGALGYRVFDPLIEPKVLFDSSACDDVEEQLLFMKRKSKKSGQVIEATCKQTNEGFVVLQGSHIEIIDSESIPPGIKEIRKGAKIDSNHVLLEDMLFRSPSYAAAFVIGGHANGLTEWKTSDGKTLKDMENSLI